MGRTVPERSLLRVSLAKIRYVSKWRRFFRALQLIGELDLEELQQRFLRAQARLEIASLLIWVFRTTPT